MNSSDDLLPGYELNNNIDILKSLKNPSDKLALAKKILASWEALPIESTKAFETTRSIVPETRIEYLKGIITFQTEKELPEMSKEELNEIFDEIINIIKKYLDLKDEYYEVISTWIIGTYFHKEFETYPYLFINAMRGSGKTRLLKLIASLSYNGEVLASLSEAVLFRTAGHTTMCIDEFEQVGSKDKQSLRELLNAAYKKGIKVKRSRKVKTEDGENQQVDEFEVFTPIAMANIWGMEDVLGDRCINIMIEKSNKKTVTKLIEDFSTNKEIIRIKERISGVKWSLILQKTMIEEWNDYIINNSSGYTMDITTNTTTPLNSTKLHFFRVMDEANLEGRHLELFFALYLITNAISEEKLNKMIIFSKDSVDDKKIDDRIANKDIMLIDFFSQQELGLYDEFISINKITKDFREFIDDNDEDNKWLNNRWVGRAIKRVGLLIKRRKMGKGNEALVDIDKAKNKILMFKPKDEKQEELKPKDPGLFKLSDKVLMPCSRCGTTEIPCEYEDSKHNVYCKVCAELAKED